MEPLNPVQIEQAIRELVTRISKGIRVCSDRYSEFLEADREFDRSFAQAYLKAEGSIEDKKRMATLETISEREKRDVSDAAYRHANRLAQALELELRAYQSIGASVRSMYGASGSAHGV